MAACFFATGAEAGQYEFLAAPQINLSLVYRLDKLSGDVIACQFAHNPGRPDVGPGAFGVTSCYRSGDGATKQEPSDYGLIATRHEQEGGVFRVDYRTGGLSICYLYFQREKQGDHEAIADQYVVCTPSWKQAAFGRTNPLLLRRPASARPRKPVLSLSKGRVHLAPPVSRVLTRPSRRAFNAPQDEAEGGGRFRSSRGLAPFSRPPTVIASLRASKDARPSGGAMANQSRGT
jgi:hypothetical protein